MKYTSHIPTLIDRARFKNKQIDDRIVYYQGVKIKQERMFDNYLHLLDEKRHEILSINHDIEMIEDPYSRPLETGQENRKVEELIRGLEAKVKHIEGESLTLKGKCVKCKSFIDDCEYQIHKCEEKKSEIDKEIKSLEVDLIVNRSIGVQGSDYLQKNGPPIDSVCTNEDEKKQVKQKDNKDESKE